MVGLLPIRELNARSCRVTKGKLFVLYCEARVTLTEIPFSLSISQSEDGVKRKDFLNPTLFQKG